MTLFCYQSAKMSTALIELAITRLHDIVHRISQQFTHYFTADWEGSVWQLYLGQPSEPWDMVSVLIAYIESDAYEERQYFAEDYRKKGIQFPKASDRAIGSPQELADIFAYLPLLPLEFGGLLTTPIVFHPPGDATLFSRPEDIGMEAYGTWTRRVGDKEVHTLYKVLPKPTPDSPRIEETVKTITLPLR